MVLSTTLHCRWPWQSSETLRGKESCWDNLLSPLCWTLAAGMSLTRCLRSSDSFWLVLPSIASIFLQLWGAGMPSSYSHPRQTPACKSLIHYKLCNPGFVHLLLCSQSFHLWQPFLIYQLFLKQQLGMTPRFQIWKYNGTQYSIVHTDSCDDPREILQYKYLWLGWGPQKVNYTHEGRS